MKRKETGITHQTVPGKNGTLESHGGGDVVHTVTATRSGLGMTVIGIWNRLSRKTGRKPRNPVRELCQWRDEKSTMAAIASGQINGNAKCQHCGNYDFACGSCVFVGQTDGGASCAFWEGAD